MEQYQIVPWDDLSTEESNSSLNLEQYVPPELERLAYEVMKSYDMNVSSMTLITSKPDKGGAIWRIETNRGPRSLKVLHRTPQRSLFSVGAQEYVVSKGARVPKIIHTKDGQNSIVAGGKLWIVTDWIDTLTPVAKIDLEGARTLCHGLGEFHVWSKGYAPPLEAANSSRIFKWESQYQKIITKIGWFRHIAEAYPNTQASSHLLSVLDTFERQAQDIMKRFHESAYKRMVAKGEAYWGLAHQDYGWSNGQMGPGGIWVIDLDGVAFDLPFRDLRKIITSTMDDMGAWDLEWIRGVISAYNDANPFDQEMFELLWIDMAFPNEFYKHVKEVVFHPVEFMDTELNAILDRVVATEANKWDVLRELEKDKAKYPAGDYPDVTVMPGQPFRYKDYAKEGTVPLIAKPGSKRGEGTEIIRLVISPNGKAKIVPGGGEARLKPAKEKEGKKLAKEEKKLSKKRKKLKKLESTERKQREERAAEPRKSAKTVAPEPTGTKKAVRRRNGSESSVLLPPKVRPTRPIPGGARNRAGAAPTPTRRGAAAPPRPRPAAGTARDGGQRTAGAARPKPILNKQKKKAGVKLYLSAYRTSMSARRTGLEYFDDLYGETAGS